MPAQGKGNLTNSRLPGLCEAFEAETGTVATAHAEALANQAFTVPALPRETNEDAVRRLAIALQTPAGSWQQETLARGGLYAPPRERAVAMVSCALPAPPQLHTEDDSSDEETPMETDKAEEEAAKAFMEDL